jgi:hypothetical protein
VIQRGGAASLPDWLTAPWPERATTEVNAWLSARTWDDREAALRDTVRLTTDQGRHDLHLLLALHPETAPALTGLEPVLDAIHDRGLDTVLDELGPAARHADLVTAWVTTVTWKESRQLLTAHPQLLSDPRTTEALRVFAARDKDSAAVAAQHEALLTLCRRLGVDEAYDVATDPDAGTEAAWDAVNRADADALELVLTAAPHLLGRPYLAPALIACLQLLRPHDDLAGCTSALEQACDQGTQTQLSALAGRLHRLVKRRPDLRDDVETLLAVLAPQLPPG